MTQAIENGYLRILRSELVPALGCTEPIAIAYASAKAAALLGCRPDHLVVRCSGNIIKNVKGVVVPNSGGLKGVDTAAVLGAVAGDAALELEVLTKITPEALDTALPLLADSDYCCVELIEGEAGLHILVEAYAGKHTAQVEIRDAHTNIVRMEKDGEVLFSSTATQSEQDDLDYSILSIQGILSFVNKVSAEDLAPILDRQVEYNTLVAKEGLSKASGAGVGSTLLKLYGDTPRGRAIAAAAAGSDARMSGCTLPVVINSGSGNQGLTVSLPVLQYAQEWKADRETTLRALALSNLISIYQKSKIGKLSAYCGAVSAAAGAGAGITYLAGGSEEAIARTIVNTLANVSGIVCDGAKASCAAKIASALDAALLGHAMAMDGHTFSSGDGLVKETLEGTMTSIGHLGKEGMKDTDIIILNLMLQR